MTYIASRPAPSVGFAATSPSQVDGEDVSLYPPHRFTMGRGTMRSMVEGQGAPKKPLSDTAASMLKSRDG